MCIYIYIHMIYAHFIYMIYKHAKKGARSADDRGAPSTQCLGRCVYNQLTAAAGLSASPVKQMCVYVCAS